VKLIKHPEDRGYPTEYLLARIRGRRTYFIDDWNKIVFHADPLTYLNSTHYGDFIRDHGVNGVWMRLLKEYRWVYFQMNRDMREIFQSFFTYSEIRTLIACFRYKKERGTTAEIETLLTHSLLVKKIRAILLMSPDSSSAIEAFGKKFISRQKTSDRLETIFLDRGLAGVEEKLNRLFFSDTDVSDQHPVIKNFFSYLIDAKNIIALYKYLRWNISTDLQFINGGSIRTSILSGLLMSRDMVLLTGLLEKMIRKGIDELNASTIENILYSALTERIRSVAGTNEDVELILDYLWRSYIEAQNLSIILHSRNMERDTVREALTGA
jgi:vacuolar-type H+-ATPase subunit C/Vma6